MKYHKGTKQLILSAAVEHAKRGHIPSMREMAREVGVSSGAPYRHFTDEAHFVDCLNEVLVEHGLEYVPSHIRKIYG